MKNLFVFLMLTLFYTQAAPAKDLVRSETVDDNPFVGSLLNALEDAQGLDGPQSAEQFLNEMLLISLLARGVGDELSEDAEQRALGILSAISEEVTAASTQVGETLVSRIMRIIMAVSAEVTVDRTPPSDIIIEGQRAARIIQEGTILTNDSYIDGPFFAVQYILVDYGEYLYACVHSHSPSNSDQSQVTHVSCAREGDDD